VLSLIVLLVVTTAWLARTIYLADRTPLWMDEVLTLWLLRLPSLSAIYDALYRGAQYTPPGHPDLLFYWLKAFGSGYISLRTPSIIGTLITAGAIFQILRRYVMPEVAVTGFILCLCQPFSIYAVQVRPYSLMLACLALMFLLWDDLSHTSSGLSIPCAARLTGIVLLCAAGLSLHIFFVFSIVSIGLTELLFELHYRRFRLSIWVALFFGGLTGLFWLPLIHRFQQYTAGDRGPHYAAAPRLGSFLSSVVGLSSPCIFFSAALLLAVGLAMAAGLPSTASKPDEQPDTFPARAIATSLFALPFFTFIFAMTFSGIYTARYSLPGSLGAILLLCIFLNARPVPAKFLTVTVSALTVGLLYLFASPRPPSAVKLEGVLASATKPYPIALAEGLVFLAEEEDRRLTPEQRSRLVFFSIPASFPFGDPTAQRQVLRWKVLNPKLPVAPVESVLSAHRCFYLYDSHQTDDDISRYLKQHGLFPISLQGMEHGDLAAFCASQDAR
jgi:hypothetical protein